MSDKLRYINHFINEAKYGNNEVRYGNEIRYSSNEHHEVPDMFSKLLSNIDENNVTTNKIDKSNNSENKKRKKKRLPDDEKQPVKKQKTKKKGESKAVKKQVTKTIITEEDSTESGSVHLMDDEPSFSSSEGIDDDGLPIAKDLKLTKKNRKFDDKKDTNSNLIKKNKEGNQNKTNNLNKDEEADEKGIVWQIDRSWSKRYFRRLLQLPPNKKADEVAIALLNHRKEYDREGQLLLQWRDTRREWSNISCCIKDIGLKAVNCYLKDNNLTKEMMGYKSLKQIREEKKEKLEKLLIEAKKRKLMANENSKC